MVRQCNIFDQNKIKKIFLGLIAVVSVVTIFTNEAAAFGEGKYCEPQRIIESKDLSEDQKAKINEIYAAELKLCKSQNALAKKYAEDKDIGMWDSMISDFGMGSKTAELATYVQDAKLIDMVDKDGKITDPEAAEYIDILSKTNPNMTQKMKEELKNYNNLKQEDPELFKKAHEVGTDAFIEATEGVSWIPAAAQHSNPAASGGADVMNQAGAYVRGKAAGSVVDKMRENGASQEEIDAYQTKMLEAEAIISVKESYGLTDNQTKAMANMRQDQMKENFDKPCVIKGMRKTYQDNCYSCIIVKTLIETFLTACAATYDITSEAGVKILTLGSLIWVAFFVLKNISSLVNVEPGAIMNSLTVFFFKVMVAYLLITSGLGVIVKYAVNPFLTAGADFGLALMSTTSDFSGTVDSRYVLKVATVEAEDKKSSTEIVSADVMNKIMLFTQNLNKTVSTNLVIGHAITCHSLNAGAWNLGPFKIINLILWIQGAFIWFIGFMLTLSICYYLLDISFKLGFAIMAFPVVLGLWPFNITKGKVTAVFSIILKSGATFAFLALTTTYALLMIDEALRGIPTLLDQIEAGKTQWVADTFDITGPFFLIILFVYLYSMKLIGSTITDYVDKFFSDSVFGSASPMHGKLTQMTDFAKQQAMRALKSTEQKAKEAIKEEAISKMKTAAKFAKGLASGSANGDTNGEDGGAAGKAGGAVKGAGAATQQAGKAVEGAGEGVNQAGKGVEQAGKLTSKGGDGLMKGGAKLTGGTFGIGAIVGVPMMIAGAAMKAGGKTAEVAGKGAQQVGKAMKKSGKQMQKVGKKIEEAGKKIEKVGKDLQFGKGNTGKEDKNKTENKEDKPSSAANSGGDSQQDEQIPSQQEPAADGGDQQQPATQAPDDNDENQNNK